MVVVLSLLWRSEPSLKRITNENERKDFIISTLIHDIVLDYNEETKQFFATVHYNYNELGTQTASGSTGNNPLHSGLVGPVGFEPTTNRL